MPWICCAFKRGVLKPPPKSTATPYAGWRSLESVTKFGDEIPIDQTAWLAAASPGREHEVPVDEHEHSFVTNLLQVSQDGGHTLDEFAEGLCAVAVDPSRVAPSPRCPHGRRLLGFGGASVPGHIEVGELLRRLGLDRRAGKFGDQWRCGLPGAKEGRDNDEVRRDVNPCGELCRLFAAFRGQWN